MGRTQREKQRSKRAAFIPPSRPNPTTTTPVRSSALSPLVSHAPSTPSYSSSSPASSFPHHVDLLRVAFLEWLLPLKALTSPHELWDRFMADWAAIPGHELPVQSSRPHTLFSHVRALRNSNNMGAMRKEVRAGRAKLGRGAAGDEGGLKPHQTLLQWYLEGADGGAEQLVGEVQSGVTVSDDEAEQTPQQQGQTEAGSDGSRSNGAKRKRTAATPSTAEETSSSIAGKRRKGVAQPQFEQLSASASPLLTANANLWEALADG